MKGFQVAAILAVVLCAAYAQRVPLCSSLRNDFEDVLFRNGQRVRDACPVQCVRSDGRARTFYTCCPGFTADVENGADEDGLVVVDAREVEVKCEPDVDRATATQPPPTTTASASQTASSTSTIPQGDSDTCRGGGPERESQYIPASRDSLCPFTCETAVASNGVVFRTSTRTVLKCCSGEPILIPSLRLYRCPEPTQPTQPTQPTRPTQPSVPLASTVQSSTVQRTAATAAPTRATAAPTRAPTAAPTRATIATAAPTDDRCTDGGPQFASQYIRSSRNRLCQYTCETPVASNGVVFRTSTRTIHRCCSGEPILIPSLRLYRCP